MAIHASHASLPYPIKGARFSFQIPYFNASTGAPSAPVTPDTEISKDNGAATDCAEEVVATSGMDGFALMTLSGAETDCSVVALNAKAASGPGPSLATLYPRVLASVGTGTLSAGSAGGGTLGTLLAYDVTGCFIKTTGGTGGGGTGGANNQARKIITYNVTTGAFTVAPNWETTVDATTTYGVLLPEGVTLGMLRALNPATPGSTLVVVGGVANANVTAMAANTMTAAAAASDLTTELQAGLATAAALATVAGNVTSIKASTDNLPVDPADQSLIIAATTSIMTAVSDIPTNAELATALGTADDAVLAAVATLQTTADAIPTNAELATALAAADDAILARLGTPEGASIAEDISNVYDGSGGVTAGEIADAVRTELTVELAAIITIEDAVDEVKDQTDLLTFTGSLVRADLRSVAGGAALEAGVDGGQSYGEP